MFGLLSVVTASEGVLMSTKYVRGSPARSLISAVSAVLALSMISCPFHLTDVFLEENSKLRLALLKLYGRFEVRLLRVLYHILKSPAVRNKWIRKALYFGVIKFLAEHALACKVMTLEEIKRFITEELPEDSRIAVGPCRCRLATHACDHPLETDIIILTGTNIWLELFPEDYREIGKEEMLQIVRDSYDLGFVPMLDRHMYWKGSANYFVVCNCCRCSCLPIMVMKTFKRDGYHYIPSTCRAVVDPEKCQACGTCIEACNFDERVLRDGIARVLDCQGCGHCVVACPNNASAMVAR
jgi:ferredoxin